MRFGAHMRLTLTQSSLVTSSLRTPSFLLLVFVDLVFSALDLKPVYKIRGRTLESYELSREDSTLNDIFILDDNLWRYTRLLEQACQTQSPARAIGVSLCCHGDHTSTIIIEVV